MNLVTSTALLLSVAVLAHPAETDLSFDVLIRHGTILDGSGRQRYRADVGVKNGFITAIGDLAKAKGATEIEANGLFVAPGFINIHSHATETGLQTAVNMLTQGVTTEILNADGMGPLNVREQLQRLRTHSAVNVGA